MVHMSLAHPFASAVCIPHYRTSLPLPFLAFLSLASLIAVIVSLTNVFVISSEMCRTLALCIVTLSRLFFFLLRLNSHDYSRQTRIDPKLRGLWDNARLWGKPHATSQFSATCGDDSGASQMQLAITFSAKPGDANRCNLILDCTR